ncbi:MAG: hypothetical protein IJB06_03650 [Bacteroidales bacterium]|nr:hypothetical protein [Bacteroidales bacterium]
MKKVFTLIVAMAAFIAAENTADAQFLKNLLNKVKGTTETVTETAVTAATTNGQAAGAALKALYTQYKADGKLDMSNLSNLMNLTTLATNVKDLKGQTNKTAFYKDFAAGLVTGSNNLVNSTNSTSIMNGLQNLVSNVDLSGLTQKAETTASNLTEKLTEASTKANTAVANANEIATSVSSILNLFKK